MSQKKSPTPTGDSSNPPHNRNWWRWSIITALKLTLVLLLTLFIYLIYLDGKVRTRFEGPRWQVPVQVFGQIQSFRPGALLNIKALSEELALANFHKVVEPELPGQFAASAHRIIMLQPGFDFPDGYQPAQRLELTEHHGRVESLRVDGKEAASVRLVPQQIARLVPDNNEDRVLLPLQRVPEKLLDTLLLVEDREFYFHHGISPLGMLRALYANLRAGHTVQGGSTLTQQLVKNMFLTREKTISRKINEALMALLLEYRYSKDQLLEAYINEVYLGQQYANGIYGFGLAAKFYFDQNIEQLTPAQMALLIGQIKGPSYYDPWRHPERARQRRDLVLQLMFERQLLSKAAYLAAIDSPLSISKQRRKRMQQHPGYMQLVKSELRYLLPNIEQQSGVRVFTGFSARSQKLLEQTVKQQLPLLEQQHQTDELETAMLVTDIKSAEIRALIGGRNYHYAGFNRALTATRQIGSLIKPLVYLAALERYEQYNFATLLDDKPLAITEDGGNVWRPKNYDGQYHQQVNLIDGLVESLNVPTVNLGMALGLDKVSEALPLLGYGNELHLRPSMLLGAISMSPIEINQLYLSLAAGGAYQPQHAITSIVARNGDVVWQSEFAPEQRLSENAAYLIDYALTKVTEQGTAKSLTWRLPEHHLAGKTGTSNDLRDSWFIGYDQQHVVTTWVGRDDDKPMKLTGSSGALVLFADYIKREGVVDKVRQMPQGIAMTTFELATGNAVTDDCRNVSQYPAVSAAIVVESQCLEKRQDKRSWLERLFGG